MDPMMQAWNEPLPSSCCPRSFGDVDVLRLHLSLYPLLLFLLSSFTDGSHPVVDKLAGLDVPQDGAGSIILRRG